MIRTLSARRSQFLQRLKRDTALKLAHGRCGASTVPDLNQESCPTQVRSWLITAKENITLAPRCKQVMTAKMDFEGHWPPALVSTELAKVPMQGIFPAVALTG